MKCINPAIGKLISRYEFGQLSEEERIAFESHILDCDYCFQSLYEMAPVVELMRQNPQLFIKALTAEEGASIGAKVGGIWSELWSRIRKAFAPIPKPVWLTAPIVAVALMVTAIHLTAPAKNYSELARIEPLPYIPIAMRAGEAPAESERLFQRGMKFYAVEKYPEAIGELSLVVMKEPNNAEAHFYLGLCYLLSHQADSAIVRLEKAIEHGGDTFLEKGHWYLGNAYLLQGEGGKALAEFDKVVELAGDYEWEAREIMKEIEEIKK